VIWEIYCCVYLRDGRPFDQLSSSMLSCETAINRPPSRSRWLRFRAHRVSKRSTSTSANIKIIQESISPKKYECSSEINENWQDKQEHRHSHCFQEKASRIEQHIVLYQVLNVIQVGFFDRGATGRTAGSIRRLR
jgi:hypothetical protein